MEINGKKLIDHQKLVTSGIIKETAILSLKSLTLTFYTPQYDSLGIYVYENENTIGFLDELRLIKALVLIFSHVVNKKHIVQEKQLKHPIPSASNNLYPKLLPLSNCHMYKFLKKSLFQRIKI